MVKMSRKLTFAIMEQANPLRTRSIMDLCDYLTDKMLVPRFAESGAKWNRDFMTFFTFDNASDPLQPTGTIRFHVPPLFAGCLASLETAIVEELGKVGIKVGAFAEEKDPADPSATIVRIPIVDNPTAALQPPEVNMSRMRGFVVLRDLLGYQPANSRYEFAADQLLQRIAAVTEDRIAACTASPVRDTQAPAGVRRMPSPISVRAVHRCLDEVRQFAQWAVAHKYTRLAAY
jgi:hypothetical protein